MARTANFVSKKPLIEIAKGGAATLALFVAYILFFFAGPLAGVFAPFPVVYYTLRNGRVVGSAIVVLAVSVLSSISPAGAFFYLFQCGIFSMLLAEFLMRGNRPGKSIVFAVAVTIGIITVSGLLYAVSSGADVNGLIVKGINTAITQSQAYYQKAGVTGEDLAVLQTALKEAGDLISRTYPALGVICFGAIGGINVLILKRMANRLPQRIEFGEFTSFRTPEKVVWLLIVSGFALLLHNEVVATISLNVLVVALFLYFVQGLAITGHFFARFNLPRFMRLIFYFVLVIQPYLLIAVTALGLFDLWCGFRTPKKQENL